MTDDWQKEVSERTEKLRRYLEKVQVQKKQSPDMEKGKVATLAGEVEEVLKVIQEDRSKGVHNFSYATKLLSEAEKKAFR
jgi:hypothetical protein